MSCGWQQVGVGVQTGLCRPFSACLEREKLIENPSFKTELGKLVWVLQSWRVLHYQWELRRLLCSCLELTMCLYREKKSDTL